MKVNITEKYQVKEIVKVKSIDLPTKPLFVKRYDTFYAIYPIFEWERDEKNYPIQDKDGNLIKSTTLVEKYECLIIDEVDIYGTGADSIMKTTLVVKSNFRSDISALYTTDNNKLHSEEIVQKKIAHILVDNDYDYQTDENKFLEIYDNVTESYRKMLIGDGK